VLLYYLAESPFGRLGRLFLRLHAELIAGKTASRSELPWRFMQDSGLFGQAIPTADAIAIGLSIIL
jgi:hypothetical protein